jgi:hypothetical protein
MNTSTALSGKRSEIRGLQEFAKAFVAGLVWRDLLAVRPQNPNDRRGFAKVVTLLDNKILELERIVGDKRQIRQWRRIANELRTSNTGGFEGFEAALRSLQLTSASCPNPFYEEITFDVPRSYAKATVDGLPEFSRTLVDAAAEAFVQEVQPKRK